MKTDALKEYVALRDQLLQERSELEARLVEIDKALGGGFAAVARASAGPGPRRGMKRAKNTMSLKAAVIKVTTGRLLAKEEILAEVDKLGYKFATLEPMKSLNTLLYTGKTFKNVDGKFTPAK